MRKKQLICLFICSLVIRAFAIGVLALLPVYASRLGATPDVIGSSLTVSFLALMAGTLASGWVSDRLQRRKSVLIGITLFSIPGIWLMGQVTQVWHLTFFTSVVFFLGGMALSLLLIIAGLFAAEDQRGKIFSILMLTDAVGGLVGGLTTGWIARVWGYSALFAVLALFWSITPGVALLLEDKVIVCVPPAPAAVSNAHTGIGRSFFLLFLASTISCIALFMVGMGRSLVMDHVGFSAAAISSTEAIGGAVLLPLTPLIGWLSDRVNRKRILMICYLAGVASLWLLSVSSVFWQFGMVIMLIKLMAIGNGTIGSALTTDLMSPDVLGKGLALFNATGSIGGIIGFMATGYAIQQFGLSVTFNVGALLPAIAIILVLLIRRSI